FNDLNETVNDINWRLSLGDGGIVNSTQDITLEPYEEVWVYVEHDYGSIGDYTINASSNLGVSNSQTALAHLSEEFSISNVTILQQDQGYSILKFNITNNNITNNFNWSINTGDSIINSTSTTQLSQGEDVWVIIEHEYASNGIYTINATSTNDDNTTKQSKNAIINITGI
ncbi:MAG TPA: hypothetical protein VI790_03845, partial [Candidatus Nanoarchaeia archaeon]|nr:hypothetical protein [Candidatus Nanoarchaeia archaeon]